MRFELTLDEIVFIQETFHFPNLLCVGERKINKSVVKSLEKRGIIENKDTYYELSGEYRLLFKHWSQMQFTVFRPDETTGRKLECILAKTDSFMVYAQNKNQVTIDYYDFDEVAMSSLLCAASKMDPKVQSVENFVITFSIEEIEEFLDSREEELEKWKGKLGIPCELLGFCIQSLATTTPNMILIENHKQNVGCLMQIANTNRGIVALKHITPQDQDKERMVLVFGDTRYVINTMYNI
jgi:hypothetical protein